MRARAGIAFVSLAILLAGAPAVAGDRLEGILRILRRVRSATGQFPTSLPRFFGFGFTDDTVGVTIRLASPPTFRDYDAIADATGLPLPRLFGREIQFHRTVCAQVPWDRLDELEALPGIVRIDIGRHPGTLAPMDVSVPEVEAPEIWTIPIDPEAEVDPGHLGQGRLVADIDSGIDVFHPMFFHRRTTGVNWPGSGSDVELRPGIDTIVLEGETVPLSLQEGVRVEGGGSEGIDGRYQPSTDWLYVDGWDWNADVGSRFDSADANGRRDFGREDGFDEDAPAFGEPIFVLDDANRNDQADANETFYMLDQSKIRAVMEPVVHVLVRDDGGDDCVAPNCLIDNRMSARGHGTGVASILLGGWPNLGRRFTGIAPGAELVLATHDSSSFPIGAGLPFATGEHADVVLYELVYLVSSFLDGSSNDEQLLAEASLAGIPQITPTGNWAGSGKTIRLTVQGGNAATVGARVPEDGSGLGVSGISVVQTTFRWREPGVAVSGLVAIPGKGNYAIVPGGEDTHDDVRVVSEMETSDRGTAKLDVMILGIGETLPVGDYSFTLENPDAATPIEIWGGGVDDRSGFAGGFVFTTDTDDSTSVAAPATADFAITVGSYSTRDTGGARDQGRLSGFSGRGTRIDGERAVDVTAPGDYDVYWARDWESNRLAWGWYAGFGGGTSAAGPHVAGAAALLGQLAPWSTPADLESAIQHGAQADVFVGDAPNDEWGYGKLRIHEAARSLPAEPLPEDGRPMFFGLPRPMDVDDPLDAGVPDPSEGNTRYHARGGWDCAVGGGGGRAAIACVWVLLGGLVWRRRRR